MAQTKIGAGALKRLIFLLCFRVLAVLATNVNATTAAAAATATTNDRAATGFSLELIRRDSSANLTDGERFNRLVKNSNARVQWLKSSSLKEANVTALRPPIDESLGAYMVAVKIGTGASQQDYLLELDTGSGLTWTQCVPCRPCFRQGGRVFDPTGSPTYRRVPCDDPICRPPRYHCSKDVCSYNVTYADLSSVRGKLSRETFAFQTGGGRGGYESMAGLAFGCSHANRMNHVNGIVAGLLGMNGNPESFAIQLGGAADGRFSYCLVPLWSEGRSGYLRFGRDIVMRGPVQRTPLVISPRNGNYYLTLLDISVGNERLNLDPSLFVPRPDGSGGVFMDSGSGISCIIRPAFSRARSALLSYFRRYSLAPVRPDLGTCFPLRSGVRRFIPPMTFHFQGANLEVAGEQMFYIMLEEEVFCWTLRVDESITLIGAAQQSNKRFTYDLRQRALSFAPEDCARDARKNVTS